jgi:hypothetical protein
MADLVTWALLRAAKAVTGLADRLLGDRARPLPCLYGTCVEPGPEEYGGLCYLHFLTLDSVEKDLARFHAGHKVSRPGDLN